MWRATVNEIGEKRYNIQMDTIQDPGLMDQASIVLRYLKDEEIQEQLFATLPVQIFSGKGMSKLLQA
jgi:hypothetical protein